MNKLELLFAIKHELLAQHKLHKPFWYMESGQYGAFDPEALKKLSNPRIHYLLEQWRKAIMETKQGDEYKENLKNIAEKATSEIEDASKQGAKTIITPVQKEWDDKPYTWVTDIEKAAGLIGDNIKRPITIIPTDIAKLKASWSEELYEASKKLLQPFACDEELRKKSLEFLAKLVETQFVWEASDWNASEGVLSGQLYPIGIHNSNNWRIDDSPAEIQNVLRQLNEKSLPLRSDHDRGIRSWIGTVKAGFLTSDVENGAKIISVEAEADDPEILRVLRKHYKKIGLSLAGKADSFCSECGEKTLPETNCKKCGSNLKTLRNIELSEVSLTCQPAWKTSKVTKFEEVD